MGRRGKATELDVAQWMLDEFEKQNGWLDQADAVFQIEREFGEAFVYENGNGNTAIGKGVLKAFRGLTPDDVVWDRYDRAWRRRAKGDSKGREA